MKLFICLCLFLSSALYGQTIQVQQLDKNFNIQELTKKDTNVKIKTLKDFHNENDTQDLPSHANVLSTLHKADLEGETKAFDSLASDQLYLRAEYFDIENLVQLYPDLSKTKLQKLIELVSKKNNDGIKK